VAVVVDPPVADEVDGLRRAVGDPSLARIPPHLTLVPPVNVRRAELGDALGRLREAAAAVPPFVLTLGRISTFMPDNPVLYLAVGGDVDRLTALRDAVFRPPLERRLSWPWVPHVTVADGIEPDRIPACLQALAGYSAVVPVDRVVLLEEQAGRQWVPVADAGLGSPARIGTGGLMVELTRGRLIDPRFAELADTGYQSGDIVLTAHCQGDLAGWARARSGPDGVNTEVYVDPGLRGQGIGGHLRAHIDWAVATTRSGPPRTTTAS
jgi:2'-5' RNA ligase